MRKIFLDTNVLVDLIANRKPFSKFAVKLFSEAEKGKIRLYISSHSIATTYYLLKKYISDGELREVLSNLLDFVNVVAVDQDSVKKGLKSKYRDFEDAIQIFSAGSVENIECIVTRNGKDYKGSEIPVLTPEEMVMKL